MRGHGRELAVCQEHSDVSLCYRAVIRELLAALKLVKLVPRPWMKLSLDHQVTFEEWDAAMEQIDRAIKKAETV